MGRVTYIQLFQITALFASVFALSLFSGGCWGGRYQWALTGQMDHGLISVDEFNFENSAGMLMVKTSDDYWVGQTEVTQSQFKKIMGRNPVDGMVSLNERVDEYRKSDIPVFYVSSEEALSFCQKLTDTAGAKGTHPQGYVYTLPTAKQWRAFVADAKEADSVFPKKNRGYGGSKEVASLRPNRLGLYDTRGNLYEYCIEKKGMMAVVKGGAYDSLEWETRQIDYQSSRRPINNELRGLNVGFRVVLVKEPGTK